VIDLTVPAPPPDLGSLRSQMATVASPPAPAGHDRPVTTELAGAPLSPAERRLRLVLVIAGVVLLAEMGVYLLPAVVGFLGLADDWIHGPFVLNSVVKAGAIGLVCLTAARNVRERSALVLVAVGAFAIWVPAGGLVLLFGDTDTGEWVFEITVAGVIFQGALAVLFYVLYRSASGSRAAAAGGAAALTDAERVLRLALLAGGVVLLAETVAYLLPAIVPIFDLKDDWIHAPFVVNSVVKAGVLGLIALLAASDVRRYSALVAVLVAGFFIWVPSGVIYLALGDTSSGAAVWAIVLGGVVFQALCALLFLVLHRRAQRARWRLSFLSPGQFRTLASLAEVVIADGPDRLEVPPEDVAQRVDGYFARFRGRRKWVYRLTLTVFLPLSLLPRRWRLWILKRWFYGGIRRRRIPQPFRGVASVGIRMAKQLCYAGYYGDPRTWDTIGYEPFSKRATPPDHEPVRLAVTHSSAVTEPTLQDIVIIGSGAAGSILAHELVAHTGRSVLLLERGGYVPQDEFTEDEAEMLGKLYADGAMQLSADFQFQVLQGSCVGGTTVVNNAVCFRLPDEVLTRWNRDSDAGIDPERLRQCFDRVERLIGVRRQAKNLNPGAVRVVAGAPGAGYREVDANIDDCLGCGYCNIGCRYGRKLSMLDGVLPAAEKAAKGRLRIVSGCEAEKLEVEEGKVRGAVCRLDDGWRVRVRGETFIVAAGAVASSLLLLKSRIASDRAGRGLSFNMGAPISGVSSGKVNSYAGLQISHYARPASSTDYLLETWFNPPVAQALTMPGWFEDHFNNMARYARMTSVGVLVGTESNASVRPGGLTGQVIDYTPSDKDLRSVVQGLCFAGETLFEADFNPVLPHTLEYKELHRPGDLDWLEQFVDNREGLTLGTGHPQGGNPVGARDGRAVVDSRFRVHDLDNLLLCDASVFPTSVGVNPQLTVMALAAYAAGHFVEEERGAWPYGRDWGASNGSGG
jgi:choline dehydrogenase-like flavoprotein